MSAGGKLPCIRFPVAPRTTIMSDSLKKRGRMDRLKINVNEYYELKYWSHKFGVSRDELKRLVRDFGERAADIEKALHKWPFPPALATGSR